jgi:hypothetical protein
MSSISADKQSGFLKTLGRKLLQRMESNTRSYEKRIINNSDWANLIIAPFGPIDIRYPVRSKGPVIDMGLTASFQF